MTDDPSDKCSYKLLQGCTWLAHKCPCWHYEEWERYSSIRTDNALENAKKTFADKASIFKPRRVVYCKYCVHRPRQDSSYRIIPPIKNGKFDETCPMIRMDWKRNKIPKDDSFCSLGEKKQ